MATEPAGMAHFIGKSGTVEAEGFTVQVKVLDVKQAFGRIDLLVKGVNAEGQKWISSEKVNFQ